MGQVDTQTLNTSKRTLRFLIIFPHVLEDFLLLNRT